jgi:hypothetical protein
VRVGICAAWGRSPNTAQCNAAGKTVWALAILLRPEKRSFAAMGSSPARGPALRELLATGRIAPAVSQVQRTGRKESVDQPLEQ